MWPPHEAQIHNAVFNTLSRPLSFTSFSSSSSSKKTRASSNMRANTMGHSKNIFWNHFGKKYDLSFEENEVDRGNTRSIYQMLLRKICDECPKFEGTLAFTNSQGKEVIIDCDSALRQALDETHNYLKLHTILNINSDSFTRAESNSPSVLAASDMLNKMNKRSNSVPSRSAYSGFFSSYSRSPTINGANRHDHQANRAISHVENSAQRYSSSSSKSHSSWSPSAIPYNSYSRTAYCQPLYYGMPPRNLVLSQLLLAGAGFHPALAYPPFISSSQRWVGPNKFCNVSLGPHYYTSGWSSVW